MAKWSRQYDPRLFDGYSSKAKTYSPRCFETHPALVLKDDLVIYGGSCLTPVVEDADLYVGFDTGMRLTERQYPWTEGCEIRFKIPDMGAPASVKQFKKLVDYVQNQLEAGKKVHAGCIGGHGRTGLFFAALVSVMLDKKDAIQYVRESYCKKAVESQSQIDWLVKHFGVSPAKPTKSWGHKSSGSKKAEGKGVTKLSTSSFRVVNHVPVAGCIWGGKTK